MRILTAKATCPACGRDCSLMDEPSVLSASQAVDRFMGRSIKCDCSPCEAEFTVRRGELAITMSLELATVEDLPCAGPA